MTAAAAVAVSTATQTCEDSANSAICDDSARVSTSVSVDGGGQVSRVKRKRKHRRPDTKPDASVVLGLHTTMAMLNRTNTQSLVLEKLQSKRHIRSWGTRVPMYVGSFRGNEQQQDHAAKEQIQLAVADVPEVVP